MGKETDMLEKTGLEPGLRRPVGRYFLGMKQRLAIAQAIMENPDILILDEPMNGLDKQGGGERHAGTVFGNEIRRKADSSGKPQPGRY